MKAKVIAVSAIIGLIFVGIYFNKESPVEDEKHEHGHSHSHGEHSHGSHGHEEHGEETIEWSKEKTQAAEIHLKKAEPGVIRNFIKASGRIIIHPDDIAYVIPKVGGVVKEIKKNQGDTVEVDDLLAVIESKEMAEAKSNYLAYARKLKLKKTFLEREEDLREISPEQDYLNTKAAFEEATIDEELAKQKLFSLGLNEEQIDKISEENPTKMRFYEMRAPFKGRVTQRNITLGEYIDNDLKAFTIANFDRAWVEINLHPNDVQFLKEGQSVEITTQDGMKTTTQIAHFNPTLSEETRTATAVVILDNKSGSWTPGKFVSANIQREATPVAILISKEAVQQLDGEDHVFILEGDTFVPREVKTGRKDEQNIEILSGVNPGETYAENNTFLLKAELEKNEAEHTH